MFESVRLAVEELAGLAPEQLADGESVVALSAVLASLDAVVCRAAAAFDASGVWATEGARSSPAWAATRCRVPIGLARRRLRLGRALRRLPAAEAAWLAGAIDGSHVEVLAGLVTENTAPALAEGGEALLVEQAKALRFGDFVTAARYWHQLADPDGAEGHAERAHQQRHVQLSQSFEGHWFGDLRLDPIGGSILSDALRHIEDELFATDWAHTKAALGRDPVLDELRRTPAQRRADALVEMATRAMAVPEDARAPVPLFSVFVDYETLSGRVCELANGTVVTPGAVARWLDGADIERVVFDSPSRVLDLGVKQRFFTGATERATKVVHRRCTDEFCAVPSSRCQTDHVIEWADGGPTDHANGEPKCPFHHRRKTEQRRRERDHRRAREQDENERTQARLAALVRWRLEPADVPLS
jgi:hypothetical protein